MTRSRPRHGLTLVEMLVATALIIFVMTILASVFTAGISALRNLRGVGSLQDQLRTATNVLRRDLAEPHFGRETTSLAGPYLSQQRLDLYDWSPPRQGFFRIWQGAPSVIEGLDGDGNASYVMNPAGMTDPTRLPALHFTVRVDMPAGQGSGRDRLFFTTSPTTALTAAGLNAQAQQLFSLNRTGAAQSHLGDIEGGTFYSPWMEVAYFLRPTGQSAGESPLFSLHRRRRVALDIRPSASAASVPIPFAGQNGALVVPQMTDVSLFEPTPGSGNAFVNTPTDLTVPYRRLGMRPPGNVNPTTMPPEAAGIFPPNNAYRSLFDDYPNAMAGAGANAIPSPGGDDLLLENVISMDIKANWDVPTDPRIAGRVPAPADYYAPNGAIQNPDSPFDNLPVAAAGFGNDVLTAGGARVFDTWTGEDVGPIRYSQWNTRLESGGNQPLTAVTIPARVRVKAIQIRLRVWDIKTQQARQVTIVQDL
jgi:type II secretory pathway pseudopilin PulG